MLATFLCSLAGGILAVLGFSRLELIAPRFVRLPAIVAAAGTVGVSAWFLRQPGLMSPGLSRAVTAASLCALASIAVVLLQPLAARKSNMTLVRVPALLGGLFGIAAACLFARPISWSNLLSAPVWLGIAGQFTGAILLGSVTVAWLLGHAYLTATKMTIVPLQSLGRWFAWSVGARGAYMLIGVALLYFDLVPGVQIPVMERLVGAWLVVSIRVAVGLIAVGVFAYMVNDCIRLRSTQSATGILYFASVFVYIGELSSQYLARELAFPL